MDEKEFNLIDEPWIKVRTPTLAVETVSLRDALLHAHTYVDLAGELPTQSILRPFGRSTSATGTTHRMSVRILPESKPRFLHSLNKLHTIYPPIEYKKVKNISRDFRG